MNQLQHLQKVIDHFTKKQIANNRLQLKASIYIVRHIVFQAISFRGQDESFSSTNCGNFLESLGIVFTLTRQLNLEEGLLGFAFKLISMSRLLNF